MRTDLSGWTVTIIAVLGVLSVAAGIAVFRVDSMARATFALNGLDVELLDGPWLAPVAGRRFDLIVSNPPFVPGPARVDYVYRDSGQAGDVLHPGGAAGRGHRTRGLGRRRGGVMGAHGHQCLSSGAD